MTERQAIKPREIIGFDGDGNPVFADNIEEAIKRNLNRKMVDNQKGLPKATRVSPAEEADRIDSNQSPRARRTKHS